MSDVVYRNREFIIIRKYTGYIIINTKKEFKKGHTHIKNYNMAKTIINLVKANKEPKSKNKYIIDSLIRLSNNHEYIKKLEDIKNEHRTKNR